MKEHIGDVSYTTKADANAARSYLSQVDESLGELTKSWNILKRLPSLDGARLTEIFAKEEEIKKFVLDSRLEVLSYITKIDPEGSVDGRSVAGSDTGTAPKLDTRSLKTEKIKNPKFSGDIRLYARFKSNFEKIVVAAHSDKDHQAYVMKTSCLQGEPKRLVENIDDIDKIWERLENRYGSTTEINAIKGIQ